MSATLDPLAPSEPAVADDVELAAVDRPTHDQHRLHAPHLHAPHLHVGHQPPPQGGSVVAALAVYEVVAVTVNGALDEDVLPSLAGVLRRLRWSSVFGKVAAASALAGMWAVVAGGVVVVAGLNRSRRR